MSTARLLTPRPSRSDLKSDPESEFQFTNRDFQTIADMVYQRSGIVLAQSKSTMVYSRLCRRLRDLKLSRFEDYIDLLKAPHGRDEIIAFTNAMTTNLTRFFRESHHFDALAHDIVPYIRKHNSPNRHLRIWSAGCSSGEEPYSIAMTLSEHFPEFSSWDARILATDLDTQMLEKAQLGLYPKDQLKDIPKPYLDRHFKAMSNSNDQGEPLFQVKDTLRQMISFKPLNLLQAWPIKGQFDVIFCRNVMIYFDNPTKTELVRRFAQVLKPGGWLIIGHSETLLDQKSHFQLIGRTMYRQTGPE